MMLENIKINMQKFNKLKSIPAYLPIVNIDTDMIIPKQFLKTIKRTGLGKNLFFEMRYDDKGKEINDFILNQNPFNNSKILIAGKNFGCGSSREHAPWALLDFGITCVISSSFADIFYSNCFKNGILPIILDEEKIKELSESSEARFRFHPANLLLGTLAHILEGEIHWTQGNLDKSIESFNIAISFEDQLTYDEPEPLPFAARHWLGAAYFATDNFPEAERVYREALQDHPNNGWSYYGLLRALEGQGKQDNQVQEAFNLSWARSDTWLRGSKF